LPSVPFLAMVTVVLYGSVLLTPVGGGIMNGCLGSVMFCGGCVGGRLGRVGVPGVTGHSCVLQGTVCVEGPEHGAPLPWGAGLVQVRVWLRVPPPHDAVHAVMLAQADQLPSAAGSVSMQG
jgi:hypothetical protein